MQSVNLRCPAFSEGIRLLSKYPFRNPLILSIDLDFFSKRAHCQVVKSEARACKGLLVQPKFTNTG